MRTRRGAGWSKEVYLTKENIHSACVVCMHTKNGELSYPTASEKLTPVTA